MKYFLLAASLLLGSYAYTQSLPIEKFYNQYKNHDQVDQINLKGWVLKLASEFSEDEDHSNLLRHVSHLRLLIMEEGNLVAPEDFSRLKKDLSKAGFEDLIQFREGKSRVEFMIKEEAETVTDVLLTVSGEDGFLLLSLEGKLHFSDLNNLDIDVEGIDQFHKLPEKRPKA